MNAEDRDCQPGELILLTSGLFDDYEVLALYRVMRAFRLSEVFAAADNLWPAERDRATAKIIESGIVEEVSYSEVNLEPLGGMHISQFESRKKGGIR